MGFEVVNGFYTGLSSFFWPAKLSIHPAHRRAIMFLLAWLKIILEGDGWTRYRTNLGKCLQKTA